MAYTAPTAADLIARYPEFEAVSEGRITLVMEEAAGSVSDRWLERDRAPAIIHLTAHLLASDGALTGDTGAVDSEYAGPITKERVGNVETTYGNGGEGSGSASASSDDYSSTEYERRYLRLLRLNFSGPMVA